MFNVWGEQMLTFREVKHVDIVPKSIQAILVGDIGGTNSNFGIFEAVDGYRLLLSIHFKSQEVFDFLMVVEQLLAYLEITYQISIEKACFASAGIVSADRMKSKPTNLPFTIDIDEILKKTNLTHAFLANDFEVIGYGLSRIKPDDIVLVNQGQPQATTNKAVIGAGTGLGKCILFWEADRSMHVPVASEGGHADFAAQSEIEYELATFIKKANRWNCNVSWEDVLSGRGIQNMYAFFRQRNATIQADASLIQHGLMPDEIFNSRHMDEHAWNTFDLYAKFYARCAKNFALDSLARGGVYIAGGIAAKNLPLFKEQSFLSEFINCGRQQELLKNIPVYVITDYNVSLYGAMEYMLLEHVRS